MKMSTDFDLD